MSLPRYELKYDPCSICNSQVEFIDYPSKPRPFGFCIAR